MTEAPLLLKVHQAAALLGIGRSKAYELIAQGELPCLRVGSVLRVPRAGLEAWIQRATQAPVDVGELTKPNASPFPCGATHRQ